MITFFLKRVQLLMTFACSAIFIQIKLRNIALGKALRRRGSFDLLVVATGNSQLTVDDDVDDTVGAVAERLATALYGASSFSIRMHRNKYLYDLHIFPGLAVYVREFFMFVNAPTIQEN